ncbi:MAG: hydrogenase maturation protease [Candidatus Krumholzibacteriales bacterium]
MSTVIIGLGNTILSDDGAGIYAARELREKLDSSFNIMEAELAGLDLMEMMKDYDRAVIIDAIKLDGEEPGTVFKLRNDDIRITPRLASCHDVDLVTAIALGRRLGLKMPDEVIIYAVQGGDVLTLNEGCTEPVERVIPDLVDEIAGTLTGKRHRRISIPLEERSNRDA